jgi:hypothetical protein
MILPTDFCRFIFKDGSRADFLCRELMIESWPPPKHLTLKNYNFERVSASILSESASEIQQIARGSLYQHLPDIIIKGE